MTTHKYIKEAFQALSPDKFIIFHGDKYEEIEVTNSVKPKLEDIIAKANEIEFNLFKEDYKNKAKALEEEIRNKISGNASSVLTAHWNNQKIIAEKVLKLKPGQGSGSSDNDKFENKLTKEEEEAFNTEIALRGLKETLHEFAQRVVNNSNIYTLSNCKVTGSMKQFYTKIEVAKTNQEVITLFEILQKHLLSI